MNKFKNKNIVTLILSAVLIVSSLLMCSSYSKIETSMNNNEYDRLIGEYVARKSSLYNYGIDNKLKQKYDLNTNINQYVTSKDGQQDHFKEEMQRFSYSFNNLIVELENTTDIKYYAIDHENHILTNTKDPLASIQNDKNIKDKYRFYVQVQFDQDGNLRIVSMKGLKGYDKYQFINDFNEWSLANQKYEDIQYSNPKNLTITYAVPLELGSHSLIARELIGSSQNRYLQYASPYIITFVFLTMLITFFMPVAVLKDNKFFKFMINIKFEILAIIWIIFAFSMTVIIPPLIGSTLLNMFPIVYKEFGIESIGYILTPAINFLFWFVYFSLFMILAYCIKYLFNVGIKYYFINHTCLGWFMKKLKILIDYITHIDFNKNTNKTVLKIVLANFVIMTLISFFWTFGIFFALFYSIIIFIILKKKFDEIQDDYKVLLAATRELSNGHFDVQINQDVGIFNPLKDEFSHIKDGFEKAVNEEVKSQKMKTELISNVSHDLKTPLTSIITYVDLLKNDKLSDEEKQNYIQVIDRNSLRLKNLIDDLFEVSKANSGNVKLELVDVDIVALIKQAQLECSDKLDEKQLDLRMNTNNDKIICHLDSFKTYRIFENLFMNICKYALSHTRVYIDIVDSTDHTTITFKNISESEMNFNENEIVERFVQGDKSRNTSGSGLGLAIVKSFTELQNGKFEINIDGDLFKSTLIFKK